MIPFHRQAILISLLLPFIAIGPQAENESTNASLAQILLKETKISKGVCALLGGSEAALGLEIARTGNFFVHILDPRPAVVASAQEAVDVEGLYGKRIVAERSPFQPLPYADNLLDLVLIPQVTNGSLNNYSLSEIMRVLRPGGVVFFGNSNPRGSLSLKELNAFCLHVPYGEQLVIGDASGLWMMLRKSPPEGIDEWPMWEHGPDNNPVSSDEVIRAPYMTQWLGNPFYNTMPMITTASGGRLFLAMGHIAHHEREEPWLNTLLARNGYNGTVLWTLKLPDGYLVHRSAYVASPETFYMIDLDGAGCLMLDPETGEEQGRIEVPNVRGQWKWISMQDGILYALAGKEKDPAETTVVRSETPAWSWGELSQGYYQERVPWGFGETLLAYDSNEKKLLWTHSEDKPIDSRALSIGGGRLYFYGPDSHVGCLDAKTGEVVWTNPDPKLRELIEEKGEGLGSTPGFRSMCFSVYTPVALFFEAQTRMNIVAVSLSDGSLLWHRRKSTNNPNMIYTDGKLFVGIGDDGNTLELHPLSGDILRDLGFKKRSCARLTATPDSFFCRGWWEGFTRYDRKSGEVFFNGAFRPSCNDGILPAHGLLYTGPWPCDCNLSVMGQIALCSAGDFSFEQKTIPDNRWERGNGSAEDVKPLDVEESDWETYRGGNDRRASSPVSLSEGIMRIWEFTPEHSFKPTVPVSAGDWIFLGGDDGKIRAIDAATGMQQWCYRTAGSILQPPTLWNGRVFTGSGDGFIYALEAQTGRLLWKFRASPVERRTMIYESLSSTWPVNSGLIVHEGVVYGAAGIIDYDGTYVYALDAKTGKLIWHNSESGHLDAKLRKGVSAQGALTIARGKLWMAGGNVVSPAIYDLSNGNYLGAKVVDGSPQTNRGEEIGVLGDSILLGGKLRFTTGENVVDPAKFEALSLDPEGVPVRLTALHKGKIPATWNDRLLVCIDGKGAVPAGYAMNDIQTYLRTGNRAETPKPLWTADSLQGCDTVSLAMAGNGVLAVYGVRRHRSFDIQWLAGILNEKDGSMKGQYALTSPPLTGGILIDRKGRIVVAHQNGQLTCLGDADALRAFTNAAIGQANDPVGQRRYIETMQSALDIVYDPAGRRELIGNLEKMGIYVEENARKAGGLTDWQILGPIPWDADRPHAEEARLGAPNLSPDQTYFDNGKELAWRPFRTHIGHGAVALDRIYGECPNSAIYAYTEFSCAEEMPLKLRIGSNDGYRCWLNGKEMATLDGGRGYVADQDTIDAHAKEGENRLLIKVTQQGNYWTFSVRLTDTNGRPLDLTK